MAVTYDKVASTTLNSNTQIVTFSSIPQTYTDLVLVINAGQNSNVFSQLDCILQLNGDTGSNYDFTYFFGSGSSISSVTVQAAGSLSCGNMLIQNSFNGSSVVNFLNYSNSTTYKNVIARGNSQLSAEVRIQQWRNTSAITSISLKPNQIYNTEQFISGSTFILYGIQAA